MSVSGSLARLAVRLVYLNTRFKLMVFRMRMKFRRIRSSDTFVVVAMSLATFTDTFIYGMIVPILPYLLIRDGKSSRDETQKWTSILLAVYGVALLIGSPLVGFISDRIHTRKSPLLVGYIAVALSTSLFLFGNTPALLIVARVFQGLAGAVVGVLSFALIADTARPENRGEFMAYASISFTWGMISGPALGLLTLDIILRLLMNENICKEQRDLPFPTTRSDERSPLLDRPNPPKESLALWDFCEPRFLMIIMVEVTVSSIFSAFETTLPLFTMQTYQWSSTNSGLVFLGVSLPSLLSIPLNRYGRNWNRRRTVAIELVLAIIPLAALRFTEENTPKHQIIFVALVVLVGLFMTTSQAQVMAEVSDTVRAIEAKHDVDSQKSSGMGTGYAFCNMAIAIGQFVGPLVAGFTRIKFGWAGMTFTLAAFSCCVGLLSLIMIRNPLERLDR
ncbi:hypothetical protein N7448_000106 [Penicillium atrosanguineum]|uniref:Uncharacterized protein n=1 Tax=Penicillium atrosanguineum TaxID=1132637 RepID=A0A9W9LAP6_9EURO|nr:hypothetical protein N7448_000106 [Penicillium atrosanguineum]KAJ5323322.1 hypothetical protein N7476_001922 [Penicillium atrosanguineum]